jgi:hypothetical protein
MGRRLRTDDHTGGPFFEKAQELCFVALIHRTEVRRTGPVRSAFPRVAAAETDCQEAFAPVGARV